MIELSSTVKLMDTRIVFITNKINNLSEGQERMEASVKLFHDSVRQLHIQVCL